MERFSFIMDGVSTKLFNKHYENKISSTTELLTSLIGVRCREVENSYSFSFDGSSVENKCKPVVMINTLCNLNIIKVSTTYDNNRDQCMYKVTVLDRHALQKMFAEKFVLNNGNDEPKKNYEPKKSVKIY